MMTREEIKEIVDYSQEHGITVKRRLQELNVPESNFSWFEDVIRRIPEYEYGEMNVSTLLPQHWSPTSTTPNKVG